MSTNTYHIVGEVIDTKKIPNPRNFNRTTITKMTVRDKTGDLYFGEVPADMPRYILGGRITFIAEVREFGEKKFSFKNARKASIEV